MGALSGEQVDSLLLFLGLRGCEGCAERHDEARLLLFDECDI